MRLSRRTVLAGGSALSLAFAGPRALGQTGARTLFVLLDGLQTSAPDPVVRQVVRTFLDNGIPVAIGLENIDTPESAWFLRFVGEIATEMPGLVEVSPEFSPPEETQRYFQLRWVSDLRKGLANSPLGLVMGHLVSKIVTVVDRSGQNSVNPYAFRAGGFRVQLRTTPTPSDVAAAGSNVSSPDWGILDISGGMPVTIGDDPQSTLERIAAGTGELFLAISLGDPATIATMDIVARATAWANALRDGIQSGRIFVTRPSDHLLQGNPGASNYLALLLDLRGGPSPGLTAFMDDLDAAGFPYATLRLEPAQSAEPRSACYSGHALAEGMLPDCIIEGSGASPEVFKASEVLLVQENAAAPWTGPRDDARLQLLVRAHDPGGFAEGRDGDPMTDRVELLAPDHVATEFQRRSLLRRLSEIRRDGRSHFYSIDGFVNQILAPEPALERLWSLRRRRVREPMLSHAHSVDESARYLEDARLAWRFIEKFTDDKTGLCLGTASPRSRNPRVTLWDLASQMFGILSAARLDLITFEDAKRRVELLLSSLPQNEIDGLRLPPAVFQSDTRAIVKPGFDACDTGRFLLALDAVSAAGLVERDRAREVLKAWDLPGTIRDGRVFNYDRNRWSEATANHCTPYTAPGYAAWGMEITSSYPSIGSVPNGDNLMRLLHRAAFLGPFGAEPILLEAVERNQSDESRFLAEILFDAQLSWFEETGELKCVSEAPLNFSPWFIYQGLRVDKRGREAWSISTKSNLAVYRTAEFMEKAELISTKSAYLWAATHPHDFTDRLMALVRAQTPIADHGFSVGVFASTNEPLEGYSDVNTNGIILTAIAKMLLGAP